MEPPRATVPPYPIICKPHILNSPLEIFLQMDGPKPVVYYRLGLGLGLWLESWHHQGNRLGKAAALCSQSEKNNPSLMEGLFTLQAELQEAWMVPTGPCFNQRPGGNTDRHSGLHFLHWFTHDLCWWAGDSSLKQLNLSTY